MSKRLRPLVLAVVASFALAGCSPVLDLPQVDLPELPTTIPTITIPEIPVPSDPEPAEAGTAEVLVAKGKLALLEVKGRAPKTGYSRDVFGQSWTDDNEAEFGHNGCDTRNDILNRDLTDVTFKPKTRDCVVATGTLADAYTGTTISFVRGQGTSNAVQVDHIVPLSDAWQKGAQNWKLANGAPDTTKLTRFANDPANLIAVDGPTNSAKGDSDAATWLPPNRAHWCSYGLSIVNVKSEYGLWVTQAEKDALGRLLDTCS